MSSLLLVVARNHIFIGIIQGNCPGKYAACCARSSTHYCITLNCCLGCAYGRAINKVNGQNWCLCAAVGYMCLPCNAKKIDKK